MVNDIYYPSIERIVEYNILVITLIKAKKADAAKVLSVNKIMSIIEECEDNKGDIYDKALVLLKGIIQQHPFASGNRRTAFIVTKEFLLKNRARFGINDNRDYVNVMQGIRECHYADEELKEWIKNGKIREFRR